MAVLVIGSAGISLYAADPVVGTCRLDTSISTVCAVSCPNPECQALHVSQSGLTGTGVRLTSGICASCGYDFSTTTAQGEIGGD